MHSETLQKPIQNSRNSKIGRKNNEILRKPFKTSQNRPGPLTALRNPSKTDSKQPQLQNWTKKHRNSTKILQNLPKQSRTLECSPKPFRKRLKTIITAPHVRSTLAKLLQLQPFLRVFPRSPPGVLRYAETVYCRQFITFWRENQRRSSKEVCRFFPLFF